MRALMATAAAVALMAMAPSAGATVVFGSAAPGDCHAAQAGAEGVVCGATETFSNPGGGSFVATESGGDALTDKLVADRGFDDSGLGVTAHAPNCDDVLCEAQAGQSITVTANGTRIVDAVIASIDMSNESFNFFVDGMQVDGVIAGGECDAPGFSVQGITCVWNNPDPNGAESITMATVSGSTVLAEVSTAEVAGVNEPSTLSLLGGALLGLGFWGWASSRRNSLIA